MTDEAPKPEPQPVPEPVIKPEVQPAAAVTPVSPNDDVNSFFTPLCFGAVAVAILFSLAVEGAETYFPGKPKAPPNPITDSYIFPK